MSHGLADWAQLESDEVVKLVTTVWSRRQTEPATSRNLTHGVLERGRWNMVAFVDDDEPIPRRQRGEVVTTRKRLQRGDVDHAPSLGSSTTTLTGLLAEQLIDTGAPLVGKGLTVDEYQGRHPVGGDQGTGDHRLAGTGRGDQYAEVVSRQSVDGRPLFGVKRGREIECVELSLTALVDQLQTLPASSTRSRSRSRSPRGRIRSPVTVSS